ncbi:alpha-1A adrenergic receptor-like [Micropterus dolomieu]|uniref:alpha-1A adrenergic receptor-like n=1 Tax=Micropterus dolomieu TaxID=147949 RepID=UPI001E8E6116|nr:alpha-1A adrenergic receptor-like [Micropterus dolomieu]
MRGETAPAWNSGNNTMWEEYTDIAFVVANSLILLLTSVVGIAANVFVVLAVYRQKSLQTLNNALVVNLAVIDILRCVIDCPILLTIIVTVYQRGHLDRLICDTQLASFSFSCCIQLLTLACVSEERYQAIAQPFKTSKRRRRIMVLIPVTWTLAILVAVFCLIFLKDSPVHVRCKGLQRETSSSYDTFGLYMLFPIWAACFGVIIGFYARIFAFVRSHNRKIFDKEATKQNAEVEGAVCMMPSKSSKERARKKKESKMAKRAGYIIITFVLFWLPLITTILMNFIVHKNKYTQSTIIQDVEILSVSVACITSLSDPIIYAAVNPQFRTEFSRLKIKVKSIFNKK